MKVARLIQLLEMYEPDAEVIIMTQPSYPFENSLMGVTSRDELFTDADCDDDKIPESMDSSDVIILTGDQLRYGTKRAWNSSHR